MEKYSSYKDSGVQWIGEIPSHWEIKRLASFFTERRTKVSDQDYAPLSVTKNGIFPQLENVAKSNDGDNRKLVLSGDFVINSRSDRKGSSGVSDYNGSVSLINIVLEPRKTVVPKFCNYLLKSRAFIEEYYRNGRGIVADLWTTRYDEMKMIKIPMPSLKEQEFITNYLDSVTSQIDTAISQQQKMIDLLNERKQIIINNAVTKGLDPNVKMKDSGVEWIGEIPEGWEVRRFKAVAEVKANLVHPENYPNLYQIAPDNIFKNSGVLHDVKTVHDSGVISDNHLFHKGQILYSKIRPNLNKVVIAPYEGLCCADMYPIETKLNTEYLQKYMLSKCFTDQVTLVIMDRVKMPKINKEELAQILVICPTIEEQQQIVHTIDKEHEALDIAINYAEQQIALLQERKQIIINEVVTGKIKVI